MPPEQRPEFLVKRVIQIFEERGRVLELHDRRKFVGLITKISLITGFDIDRPANDGPLYHRNLPENLNYRLGK